MIKSQIIIFTLFLSTILSFAKNTELRIWQWSFQINEYISPETNSHPNAFLWIPENCDYVKAVVIGQHNMQEETIMENPEFRKRMSDAGIAAIWISPGIDQVWSPSEKSQQIFNQIMDSLALISGYHELSYAPVIPIGHSAMATFPWNFAAQNTDRTLAVLSLHGDAPSTNLTGYGRKNIDWTGINLNGIPGLFVIGEYEWWESRVQPALEFKDKNPESCISFLCDAGHGHFDVSDQMIDYLCAFIEKSVQFRLPKTFSTHTPPTLIPVKPADGWLAERWRKDSLPSSKAAPYSTFKGLHKDAFWYFDKEMALYTEKIYKNQRNKKGQYIGLTSNGKILSYNPKHFYGFVPDFDPAFDGMTFHLKAFLSDSTRKFNSINHAKGKISINRICGPVKKVNDTTFKVQFYRMGLNNTRRTGDICLAAYNLGDKNNKSAVQQILIKVPFQIKKGQVQTIHFDKLENVTQKTKSIQLNAYSSGLPVQYYIQEGPAYIKDNCIVFTQIPSKSKFPVKVTIVAWQHGRIKEPAFQTAPPVAQTFYIYKK